MAQTIKIVGNPQYLVNKIKQFMWATIIITILYCYFLICLVLSKSVAPEYKFLSTMDARFIIPILLSFSIISTVIIYSINGMKFKIFEKYIYYFYLKMFQFNSFLLIPVFLFTLGILFMTFIPYGWFFFDFGYFLSMLGIILLYFVYSIKVYCESKIYYMLQITNNISDDLSKHKKDNNIIKKFNIYFKKTINNIDKQLGKDLNINELKTDEDETSRVKNTIINYLPLYLKFGTKVQIDSLKNHIHSMSLLVDKNDDFSINIIKNLIEIYKDINNFIDSKRFLIIEKERHNKLAIVKDNSPIILGTFQLIIFILYLYLEVPSQIT